MKPIHFILLAVLLHCLSLNTLQAQPPANDECTGAVTVTTNPFGTACTSPTAASTINATASVPAPSCATSAIANDDIWYSFTASTSGVIIRVSNAVQSPSGSSNIAMQLYSGSCGSLTPVDCTNGFAFGAGFKIINGLSIGNTYFLRFWTASSTNSGSFNFCVQDVPAPPANDECTGAIAINTQPFGVNCAASVSANTTGATASTPNPSCSSIDNNDDIWYSFTANSSSIILRFSNLIETTDGSAGSLGYALYNGACSSSTAAFSCSSNIGFGSGFKIIDGLSIGNTYFLRLFSQAANNYGSFNFCIQDVPPPPANDECTGAIAINTQPFGVNCAASVSANTTGATASTPNPSCSSIDNNDDIWYSFTASSSSIILRFSNLVKTTDGNTGNLGYALYNGNCPASTTAFSCSTNIGFGSGFKIIDGLTIGNTYFLRLFSLAANNYVSFNFCVQDVPPPPANDDCAGAITITTQPFGVNCAASVSANTTGATASTPNPSCTSTDNNDDIWYSFTANSSSIILRFSNLTETTGSNSANLGYALYSGTCPANTTAFSCSTNIGFGNGFKIIDGLTIGNTYFLRLFSLAANNYVSFNFCVQDVPPPPANDDCAGAIAINTQPFGVNCAASVSANTTGATASTPNPSCSSIDNNDDIWYSFTASSSSIILRFSNLTETTGSNSANLGYDLYSGTCPASTTAFSCSTNIGFGSGFKIIDGLTIGNTYFLRLFSLAANNYVSFNFCVQDVPPPPANDDCTGALPVALTLPGTLCLSTNTVNTTGATMSANSPVCTSSNNDDTWYSFTATAATVILRYSNCFETTSGAGASVGYALYNGCPVSTTALLCSNSFGFVSGFASLTGLTPGNTYLLRLFSTNADNYASFNFCLQTPLPNDECINSVSVPVTNGFCNNPTLASLNGATASTGFGTPSCRPGGPSRDVWFTIIVPATGNVIIQTAAVKLSGSDLVMTAYAGTCGALTEIACDDDGNPESAPSANHSRIVLTGRPPGELITLRITAAVSSSEEQFNICAWDETSAVLPPVSPGGNCIAGAVRNIDSTQGNIYMWVPVFDSNGNIIAEVYSDGNNLGAISSNVFVNSSGTVRSQNGKFYADRNITLTPTINAGAKIRFYLTNAELAALQAADPTVSSVASLKINRVAGLCSALFSGASTLLPQLQKNVYGNGFYLQFTTTSFSSFFADGITGALPVSLLSFNADCNKNKVVISWITSAEFNNKIFTVERSTDGLHFDPIATIAAITGLPAERKYTAADAQPPSGKLYYRLKQTDTDGTSRYLKTIIANCSGAAIHVAPNPFTSMLQVEMPSGTKKATLQVLSVSGKTLRTVNYTQGNDRLLYMPVQTLASGIYLLQIITDNKNKQVFKLVKQ